MPGREEWLATARPAQLPPAPGWTAWNIWADEGWGKTRAALEEALEWARNPERWATGHALPILVVASSDTEADAILRELRSIIPEEDATISIIPFWKVEIHPAAAPIWVMWPKMAIENLHGQFIGKVVLDGTDSYSHDERHELERVIARSLAYARDPRVIRTFRRTPGWPLSRLAGGTRYLTVGTEQAPNPAHPWVDAKW